MTKFKISYGLLIFLLLLFVGIFVPPIAMHFGFPQIAKPLYFMYGFLCHQLPERSFYLFGLQAWYTPQELAQMGYANMWILFPSDRFVGDDVIGYKLAVCARDTGLYAGLLLGGITALRVRELTKTLGLKISNSIVYVTGWRLLLAVALALPMALDGGTQLIASIINFNDPFYVSNNVLRIITGLGFGFVVGVWALSTLRVNEKEISS